MNIGLIDVDGHNFPNLALMKISSWHKQQGNNVEWVDALVGNYDRVYMSKVFTFTDDYVWPINATEVVRGGTGYNLHNKLDYEIEHAYPDYSLYGVKEAYGYLTRGCPRGCDFCIVAEKEGKVSEKVADLKEFWNGQKEIKLLDPNILACKDWKELLQQLIDSKAYVDFTQGLDIRLMTPQKAEMLNQIKIKMIHFAWDNYEFKTYDMLKKFRPLLKYNVRKLRVYVLVNFNTTIEQDLDRIYKLKELDYDPYVMIFEKEKLKKGHELKKLQRWVNNKFIFRSCATFEEYQK